MRKLGWAIAVTTLVLTVGCSEDPAKIAAKKAEAETQAKAAALKQEEDDAKKAVLAALKDPDSAKFGKFSLAGEFQGSQAACLTVNAKNSYGGYTGDSEAILAKMEGKWVVMQLGSKGIARELSHEECIRMLASK